MNTASSKGRTTASRTREDVRDELGFIDNVLRERGLHETRKGLQRVAAELERLQRENADMLTSTRMPDSAAARMSYVEMELARLRDGLRRIVEMGDYVYKPHEFAAEARALLSARQDREETA